MTRAAGFNVLHRSLYPVTAAARSSLEASYHAVESDVRIRRASAVNGAAAIGRGSERATGAAAPAKRDRARQVVFSLADGIIAL
jgi:hypothetical protein